MLILFQANFLEPQNNTWDSDASLIKINGKYYLMGCYITDAKRLYIRELSNPYTAVTPKAILSTPTYGEDNINAAPEPLYHGDRVLIVFTSRDCSSPDTKLGILEFTGTDPLNSAHWTKHPTPVFQRSDANHVYGPGHNGFFKSPDGSEDWIVYHANDKTNDGCTFARSARAQKFTWGSDGLPNFGVPVARGANVQVPSGEPLKYNVTFYCNILLRLMYLLIYQDTGSLSGTMSLSKIVLI